MQNVRPCDEHGILAIIDEVQSGMGRTGTMCAFEHYGVVPDVMAAAKGIASGMPEAAVVSDRAIMDRWSAGAHGTNYGGNPVGTAAAVATFSVIEEEGLPAKAVRMGQHLRAGLREIQAEHPVIGDARSLGLMVATEFVTPGGAPNPDAVDRVIQSCFEQKVLLLTAGTYDQVIRIIPPLIVTAEQVDAFLADYRNVVAALEDALGRRSTRSSADGAIVVWADTEVRPYNVVSHRPTSPSPPGPYANIASCRHKCARDPAARPR